MNPKLSGLAAALALAASAAAGAQEAASWSYEDGPTGPEAWGELAPEYAACGNGTQQSPVDLADPVDADLADIEILWEATPWTVVNTGRTVRVESESAGVAVIEGETYTLEHFVFHTPSEHAIEGARLPMEVQFVHVHDDGSRAVISVMIEPGTANALFAAVMAAAPSEAGTAPIEAADPRELMPFDDRFLRYQGSLTTPPCSETVVWTIMGETIEADPGDMAAFAELFPTNARPLQPLNRRYVLRQE